LKDDSYVSNKSSVASFDNEGKELKVSGHRVDHLCLEAMDDNSHLAKGLAIWPKPPPRTLLPAQP